MSDLIDRHAAIDAIIGDGPPELNYDFYYAEKIKELPPAQPDLSGYSDRLWKAAYERGKAEAQPEIIHCGECIHAMKDELFGGLWCKGKAVTNYHYCGYAERKEGEAE